MLDEALEIVKLLETQDRTDYRGTYYTLVDAPFAPKPVHGRLPILIGGGKPKMLRLIGKHADFWDSSREPDEFKAGLETVRGHAREFGRDPGEVVGSTSGVWRKPVTDKEFADRVRAYHAAGVRQMLLKHPEDRAGIETINHLAEQVIPELRAELAP